VKSVRGEASKARETEEKGKQCPHAQAHKWGRRVTIQREEREMRRGSRPWRGVLIRTSREEKGSGGDATR